MQGVRFVLLSLLVLVLVTTACSQPAHSRPGLTPTPTWGSFNPTVVPFPSATVVASPTVPVVATPQPVGER